MKLYVKTNQASPTTVLLCMGGWVSCKMITEGNYEELGLAAVLFADLPEESQERVRPVATKVDGEWVGSWENVTDELLQAEETAAQVRRSRNARLSACDWTQMPDSNVDKEAWAAYRQALRDVTEQTGFPMAIQWPVTP